MNSTRNSTSNYKKLCVLFFLSMSSNAETITCGLKQVVVNENTINKIIHEDGTVHTGVSVSNNWSYDGRAIKHKLLDTPITCSSKPKSRDEIIAELSGKIAENPEMYGMNKQQAVLMKNYTANLMKTDNQCHLLVDTAKSSSREGMFFIDCNDQSSNTKRYWISESELAQGVVKNATLPIMKSEAIDICNQEFKKMVNNPSTYDPSLILGTSHNVVETSGRNIVEIEFKASNAFGVKSPFIGRCILEAGAPIEVKIRDN
ncbi:hypothetical protein [Shewanella frigidimarina]|uniref:hypothetical protein n=1 Tax=Shewanella frigidimarina TaxID=56812 RepID=UPI003D791CF3